LYLPLIRTWLAQAGLAAEADDLAQEVLVVVVRELPGFRRQRDGSFRTWLRRVTVNRVRSWRQARARQPAARFDPTDKFLAQLEDPASALSVQWDRDHDRHVFDKLLAAARVGCEPATWEAFQLFAIEGKPAAEVAARTGLTENAVMLAKSRLLRRLRQEAAGLID
jgi:RNA polymerase sigma-70 factor (ECF subfamily)